MAGADRSEIERPVSGNQYPAGWGSDAVAEVLRDLDVEYIAMVPGASYRGLQDSLVNFLGNQRPQMLVCLHEEHSVAIAHGYAKVAGRAMAAGLHSNVGLMHASMAIFNAYCDRVPVLMLGATGPVDAMQRRPWIDWIHTSRDQGALVRPYVKWDDQPASPAAAVESVLRAWQLIHAAPNGPAYICLDVADQERALDAPLAIPDVSKFRPAPAPVASPTDVAAAAALLTSASKPVILAGRASRSPEVWSAKIALAEALGARVITDMKTGASFPNQHPLHVGGASQFLSADQKAVLAEADVVLSLDWIDLMGSLRQSLPSGAPFPKIVNATLDDHMVNGWNYDHFAVPPADVRLSCAADVAVELLCQELAITARSEATVSPEPASPAGDTLDLAFLAKSLAVAAHGHTTTYIRFPLGWASEVIPFDEPLSYLGGDGGAGIGSGPGLAVGAALALEGLKRLPIAVLGDGDFIMGASAIWTAAHYRIPLLVIVSNNQSYFNDETHQENMAIARGRPVENRWIGQRLDQPPVDISALARSFGAQSPAPVTETAELQGALAKAVEAVENGALYVLDVRVRAGYASAMPATNDET
ncbi:thiamine pyrophosphate-binding protein [Amorphus sp. 3PC139-8]|uniref:thiamine pyrophosphate-binding protein n=1 Tax=Amorphus sp. 3PC139-8 TaxID=2735676 RepID=UPI00345DF3D8